ncbi:MAG: lamin tail domain-containing protein [Phycisphaerae bacterium]|nr:lamin tail domain-containing protein [Phycisphaerae bacterium]
MKSILNRIILTAAMALTLTVQSALAACPDGDINKDCKVDIQDLAILSQEWMQGASSPADIAKDAEGKVNIADFSMLANNWSKVGSADIIINEIHYDPSPETDLTEFIELYNPMNFEVDLSDWYFDDGITYIFPAGTKIASGQYLIVSQSPVAMSNKFGVSALGPYAGRLSGDGEKIVLKNNLGQTVDEVDYGTSFPWPIASDGDGCSMELMNPSLDNDLGSSWRASGYGIEVEEQITLINAEEQWYYRKGESEPPANWNQVGYIPDLLWSQGQGGFGYDYSFNNTILSDMEDNYVTIYLRKEFDISAQAANNDKLELMVRVDDGCIIWINGTEVARPHVGDGPKDYDSTGINHEAEIETITLENAGSYLVAGTNTIAVHVLNTRIGSSDLTFDMTLKTLPDSLHNQFSPTPKAKNKSFKDNAPPNIRQVKHSPKVPTTSEETTITAKVTDPDGVASVMLSYQLVMPGSYIPSHLPLSISVLNSSPSTPFTDNAAYENPANWTTVEMDLTEEDIYSAVIPVQTSNRTLVRYRISVTDNENNTVRAPFTDDPSLNFAYYVYDGVPAYTASYKSVSPGGAGYVYPKEVMTSLPVYSLITRATDMTTCVAYNSSDRVSGTEAMAKFNWPATMIYDGVVYDHIHYRLRQRTQRYGGAGKRPFRFRFNKGNYLQAHDRYGNEFPEKWRSLNFGKMCDTALGNGNFGLTETMNNDLCELVGVPAAQMFAVHFRVVDGVEEAPNTSFGQYYGDFWGMFLGTEDYDSRFIKSRGLEDGNMYKLKYGTKDGNEIKRNQGLYSTTGDEDFQNIRNNLDPDKSGDWLNTYVDYDHWYRYNTICEFVRHRDYAPTDNWLKNRVWFFTIPDAEHPYGQMRTFIHDSDASWGPTWASDESAKGDYPEEAIYADHPGNPGGYFYYDGVYPPKPDFKQEHRNTMRHLGDIVFQPEIINTMIDDLAEIISEFSRADRDRWKDGPATTGNQDWGTMENRVYLMKQFAFTGGVYSTQTGGHAAYIRDFADSEGDADSIPDTPILSYIGTEGYPTNDLRFSCSEFSDPQGNDTFAAMQWRIAEASHTSNPIYEGVRPRIYGYVPAWQSEELTTFQQTLTFPASKIKAGHTYRVRVKFKDNTGKWGHWSEHIQIIAGEPIAIGNMASLRITELMYDPAEGTDYEFVELKNTGDEDLDISTVSFTEGITFDFAGSDITTLQPGEFVLIVKDRVAFLSKYPAISSIIAGEYDGKLSNSGEEIKLEDYWNGTIVSFTYADSRLWPLAADGNGHSLVPLVSAIPGEPDGTLQWPFNWQASTYINGSPGADDPIAAENLMINEIAAHTDFDNPPYDSNDWFELYNASEQSINIAADTWYVSDNPDNLKKWTLPATTIASGDYISYDEINDFHNPITSGFGLNKAGEQLLLSYLPTGQPGRIVDVIRFKGQANGLTYGRYPSGAPYLFTLSPSRDTQTTEIPAHLTISEVMYHPVDGKDEYIEIYNNTGSAVMVQNESGTFRLDGAVQFSFAPGTALTNGQRIIIVPFDPIAEPASLAAFELAYGVSNLTAGTDIVGPWIGSLSNRSERISIEMPQASDNPDLPADISWIIVDEMLYADTEPWPIEADGQDYSLTRESAYPGNSSYAPETWKAAIPTPGL